MRTFALSLLSLVAGCTLVEVAPEPPTKLPEVRPGYVAGYLTPEQLPNSVKLLPPPPAQESAALAADLDFHKSTRKWRDQPRWSQAIHDAELKFPKAAGHFSCELGIPISAEATPHLNMLLRRVRMDASRANDAAKSHYKRQRPFQVLKDVPCSRDESSANSYPSGHASIGWAWALVLAEVAPDRAEAILERGMDYGMSRVACGVHWMSDVEAGRIVGAATVARLHSNPVFTEQVKRAKLEVERARASGAKAPNDCAAEAKALVK